MTKLTNSLLGSLALAAFMAATAASAHSDGNRGGTAMGQGAMASGATQGGMMQGGTNMHQGQAGAEMPMYRKQGQMMRRRHHRGGGLWVTPVQHLSIDDVSHFFAHRLERRGNKRLKLGEVKQKNEDTITAQIVTVDGSLVQIFEVDRHSGIAKRAN